MELASSAGQIEAGGFFCQQGALGGVFVQLGHLPLLGQVVLEWGNVHDLAAILCNRV